MTPFKKRRLKIMTIAAVTSTDAMKILKYLEL